MNKLDKLKYLRILQEDGSYYGDIPLAIDANNVSMKNKNDLQSTIGPIDYKEEDNITQNLRRIKQKLKDIDDDFAEVDGIKTDVSQANEQINNLAAIINSLDLDVNNLGLYQDYATGYVYLTYKGLRSPQGIRLATIKSQLNQNVDDYVNTKMEEIDKELPVTIYIDSSLGNIFTNKNLNTILTAYVYRGSKDITNTISNFTWKKYNQYGILEQGWTKRNYGNTISITPQDIIGKAKIVCEIET